MDFNNNNNNNNNNNSWLHRSNNWGGKPHIDIGKSHGHSPTINKPSGIDSSSTINIGSWKDIPSPYGSIK